MSIQNILKPATLNAAWSKLYVNELNAKNITSETPLVDGNNGGWVSRTAPAPATPTGIYPAFAPLTFAGWDNANIVGNLYTPVLEEVKVRDTGLYRVHGYVRCTVSAPNPGVYAAISVNGVADPRVHVSQPVVAGAGVVGLWVSQDLALSADSTVQIGISSHSVSVNLTPQYWRLELLKLR